MKGSGQSPLSLPALARGALPLAILVVVVAALAVLAALAIVPRPALQDGYRLYAAGDQWNEGGNPYDYDAYARHGMATFPGRISDVGVGYYYPPAATALFGLIAQLPPAAALWLARAINLAALLGIAVVGLRLISSVRPVVPLDVAFLAVFCLLPFSRFNIREASLGLVVTFLFLVSFLFLRANRTIVASLIYGALFIKPTALPIVFLYLAVKRRFAVLALSLTFGAIATIGPLVLTGRPVIGTLTDWLTGLEARDTPGGVDDPSPFTTTSHTMAYALPLFLRLVNSDSPAAHAAYYVVLGILGAVAAWRLAAASRDDADTWLREAGIVSCGTLLAVYHRIYDLGLVLPGLIYVYLHFPAIRSRRIRLAAIGILAACLAVNLLPGDVTGYLPHYYPALRENYWYRLQMPYQAWMAVALMVVLWVWRPRLAKRAPVQ